MGSGASSEVDAHLRKWETAVSDLQSLCSAHRRLLDHDRVGGAHDQPLPTSAGGGSTGGNTDDTDGDRSLKRRSSSLVSFNSKPAGATVTPDTTPRAKGLEFAANPPPMPVIDESPSSKKDAQPKHNRQQVLENRKNRLAIFKSFETPDVEHLDNTLGCSHFAAVAIGLTSLLGGQKTSSDRRQKVTVEDIFFAAQVPLHMLHTHPPELTTMNDIIREFIDVDNRFKGQYTIETVHFDIAPTIGQVELGSNDVGDRQTKIQLPEFRKAVAHDVEEEVDVLRIVNFDPFVLEQALLVDDDADETAFGGQGIPTDQQKQIRNNEGAYAVVVDFRNSVQPMVTICEGVMNDQLHARLKEVPANALFKAMMMAAQGHRARGFIRISKRSKDKQNTNSDEVGYFFSPELCSGKVLGTTMEGTHAQVVCHQIAPHITAIAWALHFLSGVRPETHGHGRGLPVSDIIRTLKLPSSVFLNHDLPLDQVYIYTQQYLKERLLAFNLTLCPVLTKISREDAVPTISVFELESILIDVKTANDDPEAPAHIMIIQYNANVAHNVINIATDPQWCVLVGYDEDTQTARLLDANQNKFSLSWTCPLDRLHKSLTTFGYMMMSRPAESNSQKQPGEDSSRSSSPSATSGVSVGSLRNVPSTVQHRLDLLKHQSSGKVIDVVQNFEFPSLPNALTIVALALTRLGYFTTFDELVLALPYDISSLLIKEFGLECLDLCIVDFIKTKFLEERVFVSVKHFEKHSSGKQTVPLNHFRDLLNRTVNGTSPSKHAVIVSFNGEMITLFGGKNPFGHVGLVVEFNEAEGIVTVADANPSKYQRTWNVSIAHLHKAMQNTHTGLRLCGTVHITTEGAKRTTPAISRDYKLSLVPLQIVFYPSPSPQVQGLSFAFAQLGQFFSPEEIFYEAYLKTVSDQRRRGSQAFAWRDVEVSLAIVNKNIDANMMSLVARKFLESRKITAFQVEVLDDVDCDNLAELLTEAADPAAEYVLLLNYNTQSVHGLSNMGNSVALVEGFNTTDKTVTLIDAEYSLFGLRWTCDIPQLIEAGDLDNEGNSKYGFVKIAKKKTAASQGLKKLGATPADDAVHGEGSAPEGLKRPTRGAKFVD